MEHARRDCPRCRSAGSVTNGICQVCLKEMPPRAVQLGTEIALRTLERRRVERHLETVA